MSKPAILAALGPRLVQAAEHAARAAGSRLTDCLEVDGEPTEGHRAVWRVLAATKSVAELSELLGWPVAAIRVACASTKAAAVLSAPKSTRSARRPRARRADVAAMIEAAVAPLRAEVRELRAALGSPEALERHLDDYGPAGAVVRAAAARHGVPAGVVVGGGHANAVVSRARHDVVAELTTSAGFRWSSKAIGALLRLDHTTVLFYLRKGGIKPAGVPGRKAAA